MSATAHRPRALRSLLSTALLCLALAGCGPARSTASPAAGACEVGATECLDIPIDDGEGSSLCAPDEPECAGDAPGPDAEPCPPEGCSAEE